MAEYRCCDCKHMKELEDNSGRTIYFCMFDQSECYLEETGFNGWCELEGYAETIYQMCEER